MPRGFVYILVSPNSPYVKIGGTQQPIQLRLKGVNSSQPYSEHGPWDVFDFLEVVDWQLVERQMHRQFLRQRVDLETARELFSIPASMALEALRRVEDVLKVGHEKTVELFRNSELRNFLHRLFDITGLYGSIDMQGSWTLSLFPKTAGGRYFTVNIGRHEVAFAPKRMNSDSFPGHVLVMDQLITRYSKTIEWIESRGGGIEIADYASAKDGAVSVYFDSSFEDAGKFLMLPGVRRALVAYWQDVLSAMRQNSTKSFFARFHNYDAVHELLDFRRARKAAEYSGPAAA